jgi:hypothetical protein
MQVACSNFEVFACTSELPLFLYSCAFKWDPCGEKMSRYFFQLRVHFYALGEPAATLIPWLKSQNPFKSFLNVTNNHFRG